MSVYARLRQLLGYSPFTDEEYIEAQTENRLYDRDTAVREFEQSNDESIRVAQTLRLHAAHRSDHLAAVFRHIAQSRQSAEDTADLLRKIVEGPS